jgi:hypothetical protein
MRSVVASPAGTDAILWQIPDINNHTASGSMLPGFADATPTQKISAGQ